MPRTLLNGTLVGIGDGDRWGVGDGVAWASAIYPRVVRCWARSAHNARVSVSEGQRFSTRLHVLTLPVGERGRRQRWARPLGETQKRHRAAPVLGAALWL